MMKNMRCPLGKSSNELVIVVYKAQLAIAVSLRFIEFKTQVFKSCMLLCWNGALQMACFTRIALLQSALGLLGLSLRRARVSE